MIASSRRVFQSIATHVDCNSKHAQTKQQVVTHFVQYLSVFDHTIWSDTAYCNGIISLHYNIWCEITGKTIFICCSHSLPDIHKHQYHWSHYHHFTRDDNAITQVPHIFNFAIGYNTLSIEVRGGRDTERSQYSPETDNATY